MASETVEFELTLLNKDAGNSRVTLTRGRVTKSLLTHEFESGLRVMLFEAFRRMVDLEIRRIAGTGFIKTQGDSPKSLEEVIAISDETTKIETRDGYRTLSWYNDQKIHPQGYIEEINKVLMLLVWTWSPHFASDNMDGTNDFSSPLRACVVCGKIHHGVRTGQRVGGIQLPGFGPSGPSPVREVIAHPYNHCFNPDCFSHEIERMIDPGYVYTPPKPGEDLEADLARAIGEGVVKKDHPMGTGVVKKDH